MPRKTCPDFQDPADRVNRHFGRELQEEALDLHQLRRYACLQGVEWQLSQIRN